MAFQCRAPDIIELEFLRIHSHFPYLQNSNHKNLGVLRCKMNLAHSEFDSTTLPVHHWVFSLSREALQNGDLINTGRSTFISEPGLAATLLPPHSVASQLRMAFLGLFANDHLIRNELRKVVAAYARPVDPVELADHIASWDHWECNRGFLSNSRYDSDAKVVVELEGVRIYRLSRAYVEAVLHLCARERIGPSWPSRSSLCT
jgi:hypothetical protein